MAEKHANYLLIQDTTAGYQYANAQGPEYVMYTGAIVGDCVSNDAPQDAFPYDYHYFNDVDFWFILIGIFASCVICGCCVLICGCLSGFAVSKVAQRYDAELKDFICL